VILFIVKDLLGRCNRA